MPVDPQSLVPRHKSDFERARAAAAAGYPAVAPVLPELLEWLGDGNWPVSRPLAALLASVGEPVIPLVRKVLAPTQTGEEQWKYWCVELLVRSLPRRLAEELRPELERLAYRPTREEQSEEVDGRAREALRWLDGAE